tara:strand:+ start:932 stop:2173 length:1242 start_codon:yes stop_codon:yes gene_type:complete
LNKKIEVFTLKIIGAFFSFIVVAMVTKLMPPKEAGIFFVLIAMQLTISTFFRLGFDYILIKVNADKLNLEILFTSIVIIISFFTIIGTGGLFILSENIAKIFDLSTSSINILLLSFFPTVIVFVISFFFQGLQFPSLFTFGSTIVIPCSLILTFISFYHDVGSVWCIVISSWFSCIIMTLIFVNVVNKEVWVRPNYLYLFNTIKKCKSIFGVMVSTIVMEYALVFILGKYGSFQQVAYYTLSMRMTLLVGFVLTTYNAIYLPQYSILSFNKDILNLKVLIKKNTQQMLFIATPTILILFCFSKEIINLVNDEYVIASEVLSILLLSQIFHVMTGPSGMILMMTGFDKQNQLSQVLSASTLVISGILLVPDFGAIGAAYSYLISIVCSKCLTNFYLYKNLGFTSLPTLGFREVL